MDSDQTAPGTPPAEALAAALDDAVAVVRADGTAVPLPAGTSLRAAVAAGDPGAWSGDETARLALVARNTEDGVVISGADGRIVWVNEAFERMSGYGRASALGRRRVDLVRGPFTRTAEFARLAGELAALRPASVEFATRTKDGQAYWVGMTVKPVLEDGRVVGTIGVERDVTARRQAEERARQTLRRAESLAVALRYEKTLLTRVLGTIPHVVWWKNADLRYVGANTAFLALRGVHTQAEIVGRLEGQLDTDDELGPQFAVLEGQVLSTGEPVVDATVTVSVRGQSPRTMLVSVLPNTEGGEVAGVIGIGADISQVTELERQLAQASRLESIGQLAAGIAHEINTPVQYVSDNTRFVSESFGGVLAGLQQLSSLAAEPDAAILRRRIDEVVAAIDLDFVSAEVPSALAQSLEGLERVAQIVRAMKDFSHPGQGRVQTDLNRAVETTTQVSRNEWKYIADLELTLDPAVGLVPCFEGEIKQVVLNVIVNAAQAVEERRRAQGTDELGRLTVSTQRVGDEARIVVTDDGTGMDDATVARVFDPFFTTKGVGKGTGQGLSLSHSIVVVKHGGRIDIRSRPGRGSTFTIALPYVAPDDGSEESR